MLWNRGWGRRVALLVVTVVASLAATSSAGATEPGPPDGLWLNPTGASFTDQVLFTTSPAQTFQLTNDGSTTVTLSSIVTVGRYQAEFQPDTSDCMGGSRNGVLVPNDSCHIPVTFTPTTTGFHSGTTLEILSDATDNPYADLSGTGVAAPAPEVTLSPSTHDFGDEPVGTRSGAQTFTVENEGTAPAALRSIAVSGADAADFSADTSACPVNGSLPAGQSCDVPVTFTPTATGSRTASLDVQSDGGSPSSALTGTGVAASITLSPSSHDFGDQLVGTTSAVTRFTVSNPTPATVTLSTIGVTGSDGADFPLNASDCTVTKASRLAPGDSCTVDVAFAPSHVGPERASLAVTSDHGDPSSDLSGTGTAPQLAMWPQQQDLGGVVVGSSNGPVPVTVSNAGSATATIASLDMNGADKDDYQLDPSGCMSGSLYRRLAAGDSCIVTVTFTPSVAGRRDAELVAVSDGGNPASAFSGLGVAPSAPAISLSPAELSFGGLPIGSTSAPQPVTITNGGGATATISAIAISGGDSGDFAVNADDCTRTHGGQLRAGASCTVQVTFTPSLIGTRTARLAVTSDGGTPTVALKGTGVGVESGGPAGVTLPVGGSLIGFD